LTTTSPRHWIAVASAEHVANGVTLGIMQVCHGQGGPLRRTRPGDTVIYYSPTGTYRGSDRLQQFIAFGIVRRTEPYQVRMSDDFHPFRRDVDYLPARPASILPLLDTLDLARGNRNLGWKFRLGLVEISDGDCACIAHAMGVVRPKISEEPADVQLPDVPRRGGRRGA